MKIIFMGTPDFAVESLDKIVKAGHEVIAVVSQPDRPSGRGMKLQPTPVKAYALEHGFEVYQPEKIKKNFEFIEMIRQKKPDVIVVVAFGQILPKVLLEVPSQGCINVHGSLLPKYRGAAPIQWAVINGEEETGITTMYMDVGMDTGDMILKESFPIGLEDTFGMVYEKMKVLGGKLIVKTLDLIEKKMAPREKQPEEFTLAPMIHKEDCKIDWKKSAKEIKNLIRGLNPIPGAYTTIEGKIMKIWQVEIKEEQRKEEPGKILCADSQNGLDIATRDGVISLLEIQAQGAKRMSVQDYLRGNKVEVGKVLL